MPILGALAARGEIGRAAVIPPGMPPGSDVGNMSILGYDPVATTPVAPRSRPPPSASSSPTTRSPTAATWSPSATTAPWSTSPAATRPPTTPRRSSRRSTRRSAGPRPTVPSFHPGVQYRHIIVAPSTWADAECTPPHDLSDKPVVWPTGPSAPRLQQLMDASAARSSGRSPLAANQIWLWGQGCRPRLPSFADRYGARGRPRHRRRPGARARRAHRHRGDRGRGRHGLVRHQLRGQARRRARRARRRRRPLRDPRRGHRRGGSRRQRRGEGARPRELGPPHPGRPGRRPRRASARGACCCCPTTPPRCASRRTPPTPCPTSSTTRQVAAPGGTYSEAGVADRPVVPGHELLGRLVSVR